MQSIVDPAPAMQEQPLPRELWRHPDPKSTDMEAFRKMVNKTRGKNLKVHTTPPLPLHACSRCRYLSIYKYQG